VTFLERDGKVLKQIIEKNNVDLPVVTIWWAKGKKKPLAGGVLGGRRSRVGGSVKVSVVGLLAKSLIVN